MNISNLAGRRVFVSGGSGVIGQELLPKLLDAGAIVFSGDLRPAPLDLIGKILFREGDLNSLTQEEFDDFEPDIFIHLAATFERSIESKDFFTPNFTHNIQLTQKLFDMCRHSKSLQRVIFASSYLVYDSEIYLGKLASDSSYCLNELSEILPRNLVGLSKYYGERQLDFLSPDSTGSFSWASIRIFRGFGKGSRCIISRWVRDLIDNKEIEVYGENSSFDYIYSEQTAEGILRVAQEPNAKGIFNLGTGIATPIIDIVNILNQEFPQAKIKFLNIEVKNEKSFAATEKLFGVINWVPTKPIVDSIREIIEFEKRDREIMNLPGVLLSSSGSKVPLVEALKNELKWEAKGRRISLGDNNPNVLTNNLDYDFILFPETITSNFQKIVSILKMENIKYVIPTRDEELFFYAKHKEDFKKNGIIVMVSDAETIETCADKLLFFETLSLLNLPVIKSFENLDDISDLSQSKYVVKERFGSGSKSIGLNLDYSSALRHSTLLQNPIFQPYIQGRELSIDVYSSESSEVDSLIIRERNLILDGESVISKIVVDPEIRLLVSDMVSKLKIKGHALIQIIRSEEKLHIVECNPRFGGASTLSLHAGIFSILRMINQNEYDQILIPNRKSSFYQLKRIKKDLFT